MTVRDRSEELWTGASDAGPSRAAFNATGTADPAYGEPGNPTHYHRRVVYLLNAIPVGLPLPVLGVRRRDLEATGAPLRPILLAVACAIFRRVYIRKLVPCVQRPLWAPVVPDALAAVELPGWNGG